MFVKVHNIFNMLQKINCVANFTFRYREVHKNLMERKGILKPYAELRRFFY